MQLIWRLIQFLLKNIKTNKFNKNVSKGLKLTKKRTFYLIEKSISVLRMNCGNYKVWQTELNQIFRELKTEILSFKERLIVRVSTRSRIILSKESKKSEETMS